jgi:hypothetical protein
MFFLNFKNKLKNFNIYNIIKTFFYIKIINLAKVILKILFFSSLNLNLIFAKNIFIN